MTVDEIARQIQDALKVEVSHKDAPQLRDGHPVMVDIHAYHGDKAFVIRVMDPDLIYPPR